MSPNDPMHAQARRVFGGTTLGPTVTNAGTTGAVWGWMVEIIATVPDSAFFWKVTQKATDIGSFSTSSSGSLPINMQEHDDLSSEDYEFSRNVGNHIYVLDAPGIGQSFNGEKVVSGILKQDFVTVLEGTGPDNQNCRKEIRWSIETEIRNGRVFSQYPTW
jgi:hypothetical protein